MGNRANFVVVENQDWRLYYSHWAGCRMLDALLGGPELAQRYVASLRACPKTEWTDRAWADGGAVIDLDRRRLLFFGDELMIGIPERRAMLGVLAAVWPDYTINWAYSGVAELAEYVGAELRVHEWGKCPTTKPATDRNALCQVVSVLDPGGRLRMWPLGWTISQAWHGPTLVDKLPGHGVTRLVLGTIPEGGVHVDIPRKTVGVWCTADTMGIFQELPSLWAGWKTECWNDRFEDQVLRCGCALRLPELDLIAAVDSAQAWIHQRVFQGFADSPAGHIVEIAKLLAPLAPGLAVGADAVTSAGVQPTSAEWDRFSAACDALRTHHGGEVA